jgi:hypothetical protein
MSYTFKTTNELVKLFCNSSKVSQLWIWKHDGITQLLW